MRTADIPAADGLLRTTLGGRIQARRGELVDVLEHGTGLLAFEDPAAAEPIGIVTWSTDRAEPIAEVRALAVAAPVRGRGTGRALLDAAAEALRASGATHAWLVTTNDNLAALALYQQAGWRLAALRPGAVDEARRRLKPSIPELGAHDVPLHDELELMLVL